MEAGMSASVRDPHLSERELVSPFELTPWTLCRFVATGAQTSDSEGGDRHPGEASSSLRYVRVFVKEQLSTRRAVAGRAAKDSDCSHRTSPILRRLSSQLTLNGPTQERERETVVPPNRFYRPATPSRVVTSPGK